MTDKPMTPDQAMTPDDALEIVKRQAYQGDVRPGDVLLALDVLSRLHAHWSRFKVGDEVWFSRKPGIGADIVVGLFLEGGGEIVVATFAHGEIDESECFATREEAECERRNKERT